MSNYGQETALPQVNQTDHSNWTQFELDLIHCIRYKHPIIYTTTKDLNRYQRAVATKIAWREITTRFKDVPEEKIKSTWKLIHDCYVKSKIIFGKNVPEKCKFLDGSLSFLDSELDFLNLDKETNSNIVHQNDGNPTQETVANENVTVEGPLQITYDPKPFIRELLHEEIYISDDDDINIKIEEDKNDSDVVYVSDIEEVTPSYHCGKETVESSEASGEPKKKWNEEELLNATRLTQEMIEELIQIKTKGYWNP